MSSVGKSSRLLGEGLDRRPWKLEADTETKGSWGREELGVQGTEEQVLYEDPITERTWMEGVVSSCLYLNLTSRVIVRHKDQS